MIIVVYMNRSNYHTSFDSSGRCYEYIREAFSTFEGCHEYKGEQYPPS